MRCLIVDAVVGVEPGTIVRVPLEELSHAGAPTPRSSHQLPISQVIALTAALRDGVPAGCLVGVGGHTFGYGSRLSAAVRASLPAFGEAIAAEAGHLIGADRCA
jgi:hydrogenase maturation protease